MTSPAALPWPAHVYAVPMTTRFRGITVREGVLIQGPAGWGDFCPFPEYDDAEAARWLATAVEAAEGTWPAPVRDRVPVNVTVPAVGPEQAHAIVAGSGCRTAKVKVAGGALAGDVERVAAVRDALGPGGAIRALDAAAGGLEYVEQPCRTIGELAAVRRRVAVPVAADESIRRAEDPLRVALAGAADIAVIKCTPLGGVRASLAVAEACGLPCVVSSALETSVGLAAQLALAGALPELGHACGLGTTSLFTTDVVPTPMRPVDGHLAVPTTPPTPDPARLADLRPTPRRERWWLDRLTRVTALLRRS